MLQRRVKPVTEDRVRGHAAVLDVMSVLMEEGCQQNGILGMELGGLPIGEGRLGNDQAARALVSESGEGCGQVIDERLRVSADGGQFWEWRKYVAIGVTCQKSNSEAQGVAVQGHYQPPQRR